MFLRRFSHLAIGIGLTDHSCQPELAHDTTNLFMIHYYAIQFLQPHFDDQCACCSVQGFKMPLNKLEVVWIGRLS